MSSQIDFYENPCSICDMPMKKEFLCRVLDDGAELPEVIGSRSEYDYYTVCKKCHKIAIRSRRYNQWCIRRSEFERLQHERSTPTIKQPE